MLKKRYVVRSIIMFLLFICFINIRTITCNAYNNKEISNSKKIILIDPGHGGMDGGAVSKNGTLEKGINLEISKKLKQCLEKKGFKVEMTREEDKGLYSNKGKVRDKKNEDLTNRCKMKLTTNCDLFISIHLNMFTQSKYHGAQVWYSKEGESAELAHIVQQNLKKDLDKKNNRQEKCAKGAYKILRCNNSIPSILVECGFLSNPEEEKKLKESAYQDKIASSICSSIEEFFKIKNSR
ncbi:N-acetylmuramoyl-L-alanine amidase CwlD [Clostridium botulinum C]|uniref:N-acetylmuramoyl-L-alanine amidase CwlD n=3 Tax=Clostridium botulinum TaxID=1491 RepID=A0A9Q4XUG6_CLOBO|nr:MULTISPECIES: N-acetylmuramoyl-L-alanine amidase CwlD [Clostridium]AYF53722.1 N-acetylmuramoyl-L-alanine amidase CwlD [Clostridium novyi]EES90678.1 N-acetylmuramoyl-L-alanine amidase CwlD [Clostridium botulinum D str. 1873]KEI08775.1 N-acetylmuramoyl-L-alanine amidase [Clostridium sp. K25]MBO3442115.1 N-acetylmuramoyl-L-alanine amidase CwlD [Clostridium haemolyticum]MCD3195149.1 N-acetylmuramoyl-L-alanine amidase CwlD [Clostridium botulinum C]